MHGPIFYIFFLVPGTMFVIEKIGIAMVLNKAKYGNVYIEKVNLLPSKVSGIKGGVKVGASVSPERL